ncbi:MAG: hypothetical protein V4642_04885 [Bacteroidota bacterium]
MNLSAKETQQLQDNLTKIDERFKQISKLLPFSRVVSVDELNSLLEPLYQSLLSTGIIDEQGRIKKEDVFTSFPEIHYLGYEGKDLMDSLYSIEYDPEINSGILTWNGYVTSQEFRFINTKFLDFAREHKLTKMLRDTRNFVILSPADRTWFIEYMIPQFQDAGIRYSAIVIPNNRISRMMVEELTNHAEPYNINVQCFQTPKEARGWLATVDK